MAPKIEASTREEREAYIREHFACRADCDSCGLCRIYRGESPEVVYIPYIEGEVEFLTIASKYR